MWPNRRAYRLALAHGLVLSALLFGAGTKVVRGDDDDDLVEIRPERLNRMVFQQAAGKIRITERNIDSWIYGNEARGRERLDASLRQKVDEIAKVCTLSETQKTKLSLAGQGDIQRFVRRVDDLKAKCQTGGLSPEQYNALFQESRPLRAQLQQGLFANGSLFHKALFTALRPDQVAQCEQVDQERRIYRYRARVELAVAQLDSVVGLTDEQRQRLVRLALDKTRPPLHFGQTDRFVVLLQLSRLPEETVKPIFDAGQWRLIQREFVNARRMAPFLKQNGVVFDDGDEPSREAEAGLRRRRDARQDR
jgi:hypothetical protein